MDRDQASRRTRAAQALAGYPSVEKLAEALEGSGVGLKRLREIYQQRGNEPRRVELREIADACGVPFEFFTADLAKLGETNGVTREELDEHLEEIDKKITDLEAFIINRTLRRDDGLADERTGGDQ